jgi:hypothetical protein
LQNCSVRLMYQAATTLNYLSSEQQSQKARFVYLHLCCAIRNVSVRQQTDLVGKSEPSLTCTRRGKYGMAVLPSYKLSLTCVIVSHQTHCPSSLYAPHPAIGKDGNHTGHFHGYHALFFSNSSDIIDPFGNKKPKFQSTSVAYPQFASAGSSSFYPSPSLPRLHGRKEDSSEQPCLTNA